MSAFQVSEERFEAAKADPHVFVQWFKFVNLTRPVLDTMITSHVNGSTSFVYYLNKVLYPQVTSFHAGIEDGERVALLTFESDEDAIEFKLRYT